MNLHVVDTIHPDKKHVYCGHEDQLNVGTANWSQPS